MTGALINNKAFPSAWDGKARINVYGTTAGVESTITAMRPRFPPFLLQV